MPNFNPQVTGMGIGSVGLGDPNATIKMKYRWSLEVEGNNNAFYVPPFFVKSCSRPSFSIEEVQLDFLNDKAFIPGKVTWEEMEVTYIDVGGQLTGDSAFATPGLYTWIATAYNFTQGNTGGINYKFMNSKRRAYTSTLTLKLYSGCGDTIEEWIIADAWIKNAKFGDLAYETNEKVEVALTLRFSQVNYISRCPGITPYFACEPCN